jgi:thiol-disulfide isomerase/thioredoxin
MSRLSRTWMKQISLALLVPFIVGAAWLLVSQPRPASAAQPVVIYFFWGDGCPHCAEAKPWLEDLSQKYPEIEVRAYEVWKSAENRDLMMQMAQAQGFEPQYVPTFFIGDRHWVGYSSAISAEIEVAVNTCRQNGCRDAGAGVIPGIEEQPLPENPDETVTPASDVITLPLIGEVDLAGQSLLVSTLLISFVDGFNPCSVWVLSMLLALTLHTGSRKKVIIIGLVFLTVTAFIYALFIAGLFTMFTIISFVGWIQVVVALVSLFFGAVNIKDYFWYKEGLSFTIADDKKPGIFQKMRKVLDAGDSFWGTIGATVVLGAGVSLVEFSCTAGFPVLWSNLLSAQQVTPVVFILLLLVYMVIYQLDELGIFFAAVISLRASKLEEKQGRILKLIGGTLMVTLAAVMIINPALMNSLSSSLLIFGAALGAALLILLVHRVILPKFGILIGSEGQPKGKSRKR